MWEHCAPRRPVVGVVVAPDIKIEWDALCIEDAPKLYAGIGIFVVAAAGEDVNVVLGAEEIQPILICKVR